MCTALSMRLLGPVGAHSASASGDVDTATVGYQQFIEHYEVPQLIGPRLELCGFRFLVSGFGEEVWPVDVLTDLIVVLWKLPSFVDAWAKRDVELTIDFCEQGIERLITFTQVTPSDFRVACHSATKFAPTPESYRASVDDVYGLIRALVDDIQAALGRCAPDLYARAEVQEWLQSIQIAPRRDASA